MSREYWLDKEAEFYVVTQSGRFVQVPHGKRVRLSSLPEGDVFAHRVGTDVTIIYGVTGCCLSRRLQPLFSPTLEAAIEEAELTLKERGYAKRLAKRLLQAKCWRVMNDGLSSRYRWEDTEDDETA